MGHRSIRHVGLFAAWALLVVSCQSGSIDEPAAVAGTTEPISGVVSPDLGLDGTGSVPRTSGSTTTASTETPTNTASTEASTSTSVAPTEIAPTTTTTTTALPTDTSSTTTTVGPSAGVGLVGEGVVAVVGCSNTAMAASGYQQLSDFDLLAQGPLGGGSWGKWGDPIHSKYQQYWGWYEERRPAGGYQGVWLQICLRDSEHNGTVTDQIEQWATHIVTEVQRRDGTLPIWVSGINFYDFPCSATGSAGPVVAGAAADWVAGEFAGVARGPDLGPLQPDHVRTDDCHPNDEGMLVLGAQLVAFFDGE